MKGRRLIFILAAGLLVQQLQAEPDSSALDQIIFSSRSNVLKENIVDIEYRSNQTRDNGALKEFKGYQKYHDDFGVLCKMKLMPEVEVSHEFSLGFKSMDDWNEYESSINNKDGGLTESLKQSQTSRVTYTAHPKLKLSFFNTLTSDVQNSAEAMNNQLEYGTQLEWKMLPLTTVTPQLSQRTNWTTNDDVRQRNRAAVSVRQELFKNVLAVVITPSYVRENESWTGYNQTQNERAVDAGVRWQVNKSANISVGNKLETVDKVIDYNEVAARRYYIEWQQQAAPELSFRVRGEYTVKEYYQGLTPTDTYQENAVRFIIGPKYSISDTLTANAELQYIMERSLTEEQQNSAREKIVSVSLKHSF